MNDLATIIIGNMQSLTGMYELMLKFGIQQIDFYQPEVIMEDGDVNSYLDCQITFHIETAIEMGLPLKKAEIQLTLCEVWTGDEEYLLEYEFESTEVKAILTELDRSITAYIDPIFTAEGINLEESEGSNEVLLTITPGTILEELEKLTDFLAAP